MEYIQPTEHNLKRVHIIRDAICDGTSLKVARGGLNIIGNMHGHCDVLNGADNLKLMHDDMQFTYAIVKIFCGVSEESDAKR